MIPSHYLRLIECTTSQIHQIGLNPQRPSSIEAIVHSRSHTPLHITRTPRKRDINTLWVLGTGVDALGQIVDVDGLVGQISACVVDAAFDDEGLAVGDDDGVVHAGAVDG